ncbi:MAG TPA: MFS transporter [Symbiobacteriaceae bacterium]|nr:MFS transporter [Symbiobacteriaceae bacterium]
MSRVFFIFFAGYGALLPFLPVYYQQIGLTPGQIALLQSLTPLLVFLSQPIFGPLADRVGNRGRLLAGVLLATGVVGAAMLLPRSFGALLPIVALFSFFRSVIVPLSDSIALGEAQRTGRAYSQLRLWGSTGFLIATNVLGFVYARYSIKLAFGIWLAGMILATLFAARLPADGVKTKRQPLGPALKRLVANRELLLFLGVTALLQMTEAAHATFFSIHLSGLGAAAGLVGVAWGLAALTEVPVWSVLPRFVRRWGPLPILTVAATFYGIRWVLYGLVGSAPLLVGLQLLQGISFALFMPVAVEEVGRLTPPDLRSSGQALLGICGGGIATVVGTLVGGVLVEAAGTSLLYTVMGGVAFVGALGYVGLLRLGTADSHLTE